MGGVSDWPTLPQLFVKGEFIGGSDITTSLYKSGELDAILGRPQQSKSTPAKSGDGTKAA